MSGKERSCESEEVWRRCNRGKGIEKEEGATNDRRMLIREGHVLVPLCPNSQLIQFSAVHSWWQDNKNMIILIPFLSLCRTSCYSSLAPSSNHQRSWALERGEMESRIFLICRFEFCVNSTDPKLKNGHSHENPRFVALLVLHPPVSAAPSSPPATAAASWMAQFVRSVRPFALNLLLVEHVKG